MPISSHRAWSIRICGRIGNRYPYPVSGYAISGRIGNRHPSTRIARPHLVGASGGRPVDVRPRPEPHLDVMFIVEDIAAVHRTSGHAQNHISISGRIGNPLPHLRAPPCASCAPWFPRPVLRAPPPASVSQPVLPFSPRRDGTGDEVTIDTRAYTAYCVGYTRRSLHLLGSSLPCMGESLFSYLRQSSVASRSVCTWQSRRETSPPSERTLTRRLPG